MSMAIHPKFGGVTLQSMREEGNYKNVVLYLTEADRDCFKRYSSGPVEEEPSSSDVIYLQYMTPNDLTQKRKDTIWQKFSWIGNDYWTEEEEKDWKTLSSEDKPLLNELIDKILDTKNVLSSQPGRIIGLETLKQQLKNALDAQIQDNEIRNQKRGAIHRHDPV